MSYLAIFHFIFLLAILCQNIQCRDFGVRDAIDLRSALDQAQPGDVINLVRESDLPKLELEGPFEITRNGTKSAPIHLNGHPNITFVHVNNSRAIINLNGNYWNLNGLVIKGDADYYGGLSITGHHNQIANCKITSYYGLIVQGSNFNNITKSTMSDCEVGIHFYQSSNNLIENCELNGSKGTSIIILSSPRNIIRNNRAVISHPDARHLAVADYGPEIKDQDLITGNTFIIEETCQKDSNLSPFFYVRNMGVGVFENNTIIDGSIGESDALFYIKAPKYNISNNWITTINSIPFKLEIEASGVKFNGNRMEFLEEREPQLYCIVGNPKFHSNTKISNDNICNNGKLTNIFDV